MRYEIFTGLGFGPYSYFGSGFAFGITIRQSNMRLFHSGPPCQETVFFAMLPQPEQCEMVGYLAAGRPSRR